MFDRYSATYQGSQYAGEDEPSQETVAALLGTGDDDRPVSRVALWTIYASIVVSITAFVIGLFARFTIGGSQSDSSSGRAWENPRLLESYAGNQVAGVVVSVAAIGFLLLALVALAQRSTMSRVYLAIGVMAWSAGIMIDMLVRKRPGGPEADPEAYGPAAVGFAVAVGLALAAIGCAIRTIRRRESVRRASARMLRSMVLVFSATIGLAWFVPIHHLVQGDDLGFSKVNMYLNESGSGHDYYFMPTQVPSTVVGNVYLALITLLSVGALAYLVGASTRRSITVAVGVLGLLSGIMGSRIVESFYSYELRQSAGLDLGGAIFLASLRGS